jgi:DNA polymerase I-like protein with 3'-5' exonuclease and polymerase domains
MVAEYTINAQRKSEGISLSELSEKYNLPKKKDKVKLYWDAGLDTFSVPARILKTYCEQDTVNALAIFHRQVPSILESRMNNLISMEMEVLKCVADMEFNGMVLDKQLLMRYNIIYGEQLEVLDQELCGVLGVENINSPQQLGAALYTVFDPEKFGIQELAGGGYSTAMPEMLKLRGKTKEQKEILSKLKERSRLSQLIKTYFNGLEKHIDHRNTIHQSLNQCITVTGRTSCSRPNLQNQPRGNTGPVKECFVSRW